MDAASKEAGGGDQNQSWKQGLFLDNTAVVQWCDGASDRSLVTKNEEIGKNKQISPTTEAVCISKYLG